MRKLFIVLLVLLVLTVSTFAQSPFNKEEFAARRAKAAGARKARALLGIVGTAPDDYVMTLHERCNAITFLSLSIR